MEIFDARLAHPRHFLVFPRRIDQTVPTLGPRCVAGRCNSSGSSAMLAAMRGAEFNEAVHC
jgi:hypothetical protein